jgi:carbon storage regulator CsrA
LEELMDVERPSVGAFCCFPNFMPGGSEMLVLSRKIGQQIVIADSIEVIVVEVRGNTVKLGFRAPVNIPIHRREVQDRIQADDEQSMPPPATGRPAIVAA